MKTQEIEQAIYAMDSNQLLALNNRYCDTFKYPSEYYHINGDEFYEVFDILARKISRSAEIGYYRYNDKYVKFDAYDNLESTNELTVDHLPELVDVMAEEIEENFHRFYDLF